MTPLFLGVVGPQVEEAGAWGRRRAHWSDKVEEGEGEEEEDQVEEVLGTVRWTLKKKKKDNVITHYTGDTQQ